MTINTIGYGDIIGVNESEISAIVILLPIGVFLYTFTVSELSLLFSEINNKATRQKEIEKSVKELAIKHNYSSELTKKIYFFFAENSNLISLSKSYEIDKLLKILPTHLKAEISYFMYQDAISKVNILQDLD